MIHISTVSLLRRKVVTLELRHLVMSVRLVEVILNLGIPLVTHLMLIFRLLVILISVEIDLLLLLNTFETVRIPILVRNIVLLLL